MQVAIDEIFEIKSVLALAEQDFEGIIHCFCVAHGAMLNVVSVARLEIRIFGLI